MNKIRTISIILIITILTSISYLLWFNNPQTQQRKLSIATGDENGMYYQYALEYKKLLKKDNINLDIITTNGSKRAQELLVNKKVDIAFIQGGSVDKSSIDILESLGSIYSEPLWIFINNKPKKYNTIKDFKGLKIIIGDVGSGTYELSKRILNLNGINNKNSTLITTNFKNGKKILINNKADILFMVISEDSPIIASLLSNSNINLFSTNRINAYQIVLPFLTSSTIYQGSYNILNNKPQKDTRLISTVASLAVRKDFPPEFVRLVMREITKVHKKETLFNNKPKFPSSNFLELSMNVKAKAYIETGENWLESIFPYWIAYSIDHFKLLLIPLLTLLLPLIKGVIPFYKWRIRRRIYRWYNDLIEVETVLFNKDSKHYQKVFSSKKLETLISEINKQTKVPSAYAGELYELKIHVEYVKNKLNNKYM